MTRASTPLICLLALSLAAGCEEDAPTGGVPAPDATLRVDGALDPDGAIDDDDAALDDDAGLDRDAAIDDDAGRDPDMAIGPDPDAGPRPDMAVDPEPDAAVDPGPDPDPDCVDPGAVLAVFETRCAFGGCHGGGARSGGLSLDPADAFGALIGVPSTEQPGTLRVAPGDVGASWLAIKLDPNPPVGSQMPLGGMLGAAERALVRDWIAAGAPTDACVDPGPDPDPSDVARVEVDAAPVRLGVGEVTVLVARPVDAAGNVVAAPVTWHADNGLIAYSDHVGGVLGVSVGETALRAVADGVESAPVPVVVVDARPVGASFFREVDPMFRQRCAVPGCHVDDIEPGDLRFDRDPDRMWEELVEDDAEEVDRPRVRPGDPAGSYLVQKLALDRPEVGGRMPLGQPPLSVGDMQKVVTWIVAGARAD